MQVARLFALAVFCLVLIALPAVAQAHHFGIAGPDAEGGLDPDSSNFEYVAVPTTRVPEAPEPRRTVTMDKKFIAVMAALGATESIRIATHKLVLDHEFAAGAPWVTSVPKSSHLVAEFGGIYAAELLLAYELKKPHGWLPGDRVIRKLWWAYPATTVPMHLANGIRSMHTQAPAGCPPSMCQ